MNKLKQVLKSKKGFTLMEVIVVIIILAVLAAALIPTFLGFVGQAAAATAIAEARLGMTAAQAVVTEAVGRQTPGGAAAVLDGINSHTGVFFEEFEAFLADDGVIAARFTGLDAGGGNRVIALIYETPNHIITIASGTTTVDTP